MTTPQELLNSLRARMSDKATDAIARASNVDKATVRKIKNDTRTETLTMRSLYRIHSGLLKMENPHD
ncbi:hypothetical protein N22_037 [Idiomarinaceae phage 1N2-2]|uniref:hypothetical protein n=1 Tax=Idiomarinaceae phage 1N2-2 TaxID=1536592 RepID=UPI0004F65BA1|nr:hypothetical protein N22_037 [Idiomarinaceae phage 1N2-2]AIM40739.1 hypothetical protein N22_037 [Idiomarinaceae phage 1N2-2]